MATGTRSFYVSDNCGRTLAGMFIENIAAHILALRGNPLIIESDGSPLLTDVARKKSKDKATRHLDFLAESGLPVIGLSRLRGEAAASFSAAEGNRPAYTEIFCHGPFEPAAAGVMEAFDYPLLLVKRDPYAAGYVFRVLQLLHDAKIYKRIGIVITGTDFIEEAALTFSEVKTEMEKMTGAKPDIIFLGYFQPDLQRLAHAKLRGLSAVQVFPDSPFHGMIKLIYENIASFEVYMKEKTVFDRLSGC